RFSHPGEAATAGRDGRPGAGHSRANADRRPRAELPCRVSRRARQPLPERRSRSAAVAPDIPAERIPGCARYERGIAAAARPRDASWALPSQGGREARRRGGAAARLRRRRRNDRFRVLRDGRELWIRRGALRAVAAGWRALAAPRRPPRFARHGHRRRWLQLPRTDPAGHWAQRPSSCRGVAERPVGNLELRSENLEGLRTRCPSYFSALSSKFV